MIKFVLLTLSLVLYTSSGYDYATCAAIPNERNQNYALCHGVRTDEGCCGCNSNNPANVLLADLTACEGCDPFPCPTEEPETTTVAEPTTTCICPTARRRMGSLPHTIKGSSIGDCDCDKGVRELRFMFLGRGGQGVSISGLKFQVYYGVGKGTKGSGPASEHGQLLCEFQDVQPNQELSCDIWKSHPAASFGYLDYQNETPFVLQAGSGEVICDSQYHTSCSSDIVGMVLDVCPEIIVSGWRDGNDDGNDCDDGLEPCSCSNDPVGEPEPEVSVPPGVVTRVGEKCYCDNGLAVTVPTTRRRLKKKKGKSSGKKKKGGGGLGYGDCDCDKDYGMQTLRLLYQGAQDVDVVFLTKDGDNACDPDTTKGIKQGEEVTCDVTTATNPTVQKLSTNTFISVYPAGTTTGGNADSIHTSCSSDIVGNAFLEGTDTEFIVSGWSDGNPLANDCDDGLDECSCNGTLLVPPEDPIEEQNVEQEQHVEDQPQGAQTPDPVCYCSNIAETEGITEDELRVRFTPSPTSKNGKRKKSKNGGFGFGNCDCDKSTSWGGKGGVDVLRFVWKGFENADIKLYTNSKKVDLADLSEDNLVCDAVDVAFGEEFECDLKTFPLDVNGEAVFRKFSTETLVVATTASEECFGSLHTSCSSDIVGHAPALIKGYCGPQVVCTGWTDTSPTKNDCDDGFVECDCEDCANEDDNGKCNSDYNNQCYWDDLSGECKSKQVTFYTKGSAVRGSLFIAAILGFIGFLFF